MTTYYFWDEIEDNVVREYDENNNTLVSYTTEPTLYGSVLSQDRGGETRYFQFDGPGNTTELTSEDVIIADTRRYTAFGQTVKTTGTTVLSYQYGGRWGYRVDTLSSSIAIRRRRCSSERARWLSTDPVPRPLDVNYYVLLRNSPAINHDPSGLRCIVNKFTSGFIRGKECTIVARPQDNPPFPIIESQIEFHASFAKPCCCCEFRQFVRASCCISYVDRISKKLIPGTKVCQGAGRSYWEDEKYGRRHDDYNFGYGLLDPAATSCRYDNKDVPHCGFEGILIMMAKMPENQLVLLAYEMDIMDIIIDECDSCMNEMIVTQFGPEQYCVVKKIEYPLKCGAYFDKGGEFIGWQ